MKRLGTDARRLAEGTGLQVLARLITAAATFAALALAARALGRSGFGVLTYYLLLWPILEVAMDMGSMTAGLRLISAEPAREGSAIRRMWQLRATLIAPCLLVVLASVLLFEEAQAGWILLASLCLLAQLLTPRTALLHRALKLRPIAAARIAGALIGLAALGTLLAAGITTAGPLLCTFGLAAVATATLSWWYAPRPTPSGAAVPTRAFLAEALPLGLGALARTLYFWMDGIFVRSYCNAAELGLFNSAYRVFNLSILVASYLSATALPLLARDHLADPARARRLARHLMVALLSLGLPLALLLAVFAEPILILAFGAEFGRAAPVLAVLAIACGAIHLGALALTVLVARRAARLVAAISVAALGLNALLDFLWVPGQGALGAARATACTEIAVVLLAVVCCRWQTARCGKELR